MALIDFGGIKNKEGKVIKENMLIRSRHLSKINNERIQYFENVNLAKIIDLRTEQEKKEKPDKIIKNVEYKHFPIFRNSTPGVTTEKEINKYQAYVHMPDIEKLYSKMVTDGKCISQIRKCIYEIINSEKYPILFHCAGGRDRTGIIAMILLSILDVDKEIIIKNYLDGNRSNKKLNHLLYLIVRIFSRDKENALRVENRFNGDERYIKVTMDTIDKEYGSMDNFLKQELLITDEMKNNFKNKLLK